MVKVSKDLDRKNLGFAFADVKCRLCAKVRENFVYFNANDDLDEFVSKFESEGQNDNENEEQESSDWGKGVVQ